MNGDTSSEWKDIIPPLLCSVQAEQILDALKDGDQHIQISLSLGINEEDVELDKRNAILRGFRLTNKQLKKVIKRDTVVFAVDEEGPYPLEIREEGYAKLVPSEDGLGAPTFELSGIKMHRTKGIDPFNDARTKVEPVISRGDYVLDTCGGMGYTSIWARRLGAEEIVSFEINPDVIALRKYNPWSVEYLKDGGIEKIEGNVVDHIDEFAKGYFDTIVHDPPRFSLAGELYGEDFIWSMREVLRHGGKIVFYTGEPYRAGRGRNFVEGIEKRLRKIKMNGSYYQDIQAIVAVKE